MKPPKKPSPPPDRSGAARNKRVREMLERAGALPTVCADTASNPICPDVPKGSVGPVTNENPRLCY